MRSLFQSVLIFVLVLSFSSCSEVEQETITQEETQIKIVQLNNTNSEILDSNITRISDPKRVEELKKLIIQQALAEEIKRIEEFKKKSIGDRYKLGDSTVVDSLITILTGKDVAQKRQVYKDLKNRYNAPSSYSIKEAQLIDAILGQINGKENEIDAIQLAGSMKINGFSDTFKKEIISGETQNLGRLFYWISKVDESIDVLNKIEQLIKSNKLPKGDIKDIVFGLSQYGKNGGEKIKIKVGQIALMIHSKKLIPTKEFDQFSNNNNNNNNNTNTSVYKLLSCIYSYSGKKAVPVAVNMLKKGIGKEEALLALLRINGVTEKKRILGYIKDSADFEIGLVPVAELYDSTQEKSLMIEVLEQFVSHKNYSPSRLDNLIDIIEVMKLAKFVEDLDSVFVDSELKNDIDYLLLLEKRNAKEVASTIYEIGFISTPYSKSTISKANTLGKYFGEEAHIYNMLAVSNISVDIDTVGLFEPVNYNQFLSYFKNNSNGHLDELLIGTKIDTSQGEVRYEITVIQGENAYIIYPRDKKNVFDMEITINLLNQLIRDKGYKPQYHVLSSKGGSTQYILGLLTQVEQFKERYGLGIKSSNDMLFESNMNSL